MKRPFLGPPPSVDDSSADPRWQKALQRYHAIAAITPGDPHYVAGRTLADQARILQKERHPLSPSVQNLSAWRAAFITGGRKVQALLDGQRGGKGRHRGWLADLNNREAALACLKRLSAHHKKIKDTVFRAALVAQFGAARAKKIPSPRILGKFAGENSNPGVDAFMFGGEKGYAAVASLKPPSDFGLHGEVLIIDHKQSDISVRWGERPLRPWLSTGIDPKSGACREIVVSPHEPGSSEVALVIRGSILDKPGDSERLLSGLMRIVYMDRGRDMRSAHIEAALLDLGVERVLALAHMPWKRGSIEGNLHRMISLFEERGIAGYLGHKTSERPAGVETSLSFEKYAETIRRWAFQEFNHTRYQKKKELPDGYWARVSRLDLARAFRAPLRMPDKDTLLVALMKRDMRTVQDTGIVLAPYTYISESREFIDLVERRAKVEIRWDPADMSKVLVFENGTLVCIAYCAQVGGEHANERMKRQYHKLNAEAKKFMREAHREDRQAALNGTYVEFIADREEEQEAVAVAGGGSGPGVVRQLLPHEFKVRGLAKGPRGVGKNQPSPTSPRRSPTRNAPEFDTFSRNVPEEMLR